MEPTNNNPKRYLRIDEEAMQLDTFEQIEPILHQIRQCQHLEHLKFSGNTLGVESARHLAVEIGHLTHLTTLDMSDIFTRRLKEEIPLSLKFIADSLLKLPNLTTIDFSHNAFGPHGAQPLTEFIKSSKSLTSLILTNNGLGETGGTMIFEALIERAKTQQKASIETIIMGRNRLDSDKVIKLVSEAIELHKDTLVCLKLPQNGIRANSMKILVESIVKCTRLEVLDLQDNTFSPEAAQQLDLDKLKNLKTLNIGECLIKNQSFIKIFKNIKTPLRIEELNLTYNELSSRSVKQLIKTLHQLKNLRKLELNGNSFPEDSKIVFELQEELAKHNDYCELGSLSDMEMDSEIESEALSDVNESEQESETDVQTLANKLDKLST